MERVGVALVGHDPIVREGIRRILTGSRFEASTACTFLEQVGSAANLSTGDAFIVLINGGSIDIEEATLAELRQKSSDVRVLVLVEEFELSSMMRALRAGVNGYLVHDLSAARLVESLEILACGETVLPPELLDVLSDNAGHDDSETAEKSLKNARLSDRETELLRCLVAGMPNKVIARRLSISEATVKVHVKAVLRKLEVSNRTQAAIWGASRGLGSVLERLDAAAPRQEAAREEEKTEVRGRATRYAVPAASLG
jgi:two-component system nitrate/nitrite response regulator NarL